MANIIQNVDDYGINLIVLRDKAIAEGKRDYAEAIEAAITKAIAGDNTLYTKICRDVAYVIGNTTMDPLRIGIEHFLPEDSCCAPENFVEK